MEKPYFKYYQDEKDDKISQKIFIKFIVIFFVVYVIVMGFGFIFYQNFSYVTISGKSMQSTLNPSPVATKTERGTEYLQDGVYIRHTHEVEYGDIIVLDTTVEGATRKTTIIKRVIGLEGDYVTIARIGGEYYVLRVKSYTSSVEVLQEDYIYSYQEWSSADQNLDYEVNGVLYESYFYDYYKNYYKYESKTFQVKELNGAEVVFFKVPEDNVFFLGDNRAHSNDSRAVGFFNLDKIDGKVVDVVKDGSNYEGNNFWWFNRLKGFFRVVWQEILIFFGSNA